MNYYGDFPPPSYMKTGVPHTGCCVCGSEGNRDKKYVWCNNEACCMVNELLPIPLWDKIPTGEYKVNTKHKWADNSVVKVQADERTMYSANY